MINILSKSEYDLSFAQGIVSTGQRVWKKLHLCFWVENKYEAKNQLIE